jgi:hypothetical protein
VDTLPIRWNTGACRTSGLARQVVIDVISAATKPLRALAVGALGLTGSAALMVLAPASGPAGATGGSVSNLVATVSPQAAGYASGNNGTTTGSLHGAPFVDPAVPNC